MGLLAANEMIDEVILGLNNPDSDELSRTLVLGWLQRELVRIVSRYPFSEFTTYEDVTTVNGTAAYTLTATDILFITGVADLTSLNPKLRVATRTDLQLWSSATSSGPPSHYLISAVSSSDGMTKTITVYPTPSSALTLRVWYRQAPNTLLDDSTTPTYTKLSPSWDDVLIDKAKTRGWMHLNEPDKAAPMVETSRLAEHEAYLATFPGGEESASLGQAFGGLHGS